MRHVMKNLTILWKNNRTWKLEQCLWKCLLMKITYGKIKCFQVCHSMRLFIVNLFILSGFTCASSGRSWFHSTTTPPWPQESGLDTMQHLWLQEAWIDLSNSLEYNETWGASKQKLRKNEKDEATYSLDFWLDPLSTQGIYLLHFYHGKIMNFSWH